MTDINQKKQVDNKKTMDAAVARVSGAVQVAGVTVSEAMVIKDEALDEVDELKTKSNYKAGDNAIKKITKDTKRVLGKNK